MPPDHALNVHSSNAQIFNAYQQQLSVGYVFWLSYSPECCVVLSVQWIMHMAHHKWQMTIFHLILQIYCSLCLKEHLHDPFMSVLACNIERTVSVLRAHGVMCVCGVVCINVHTYLCVACACVCGCMYMCISVCAFMCVSAFWTVDTNLQVTIRNHTSTKQDSYSSGNC